MPFDVNGARSAGYSDAEIADHLAKQQNFDAAGARSSGYSDSELVQHLTQQEFVKAESAAIPRPIPAHGVTPDTRGMMRSHPTRFETAEWEKRQAINSIPFTKTPAAIQQDMMGIATPSGKQAAKTAQAIVKPVPALAASQIVKGVAGVARAIGGTPEESYLGEWSPEMAQAAGVVEGQVAQDYPLPAGSGAEAMRSALTSMYAQGPMYALGALGVPSSIPLAGMGVGTGGAKLIDELNAGVPFEKALPAATIMGLSEALTEKIPFDNVVSLLRGGAQAPARELIKQTLKLYGAELLGETTNTVIEDAVDRMTLNPNKTPQELVRDIKSTFMSTLAQTTMMGGAGASIGTLAAAKPQAIPTPQSAIRQPILNQPVDLTPPVQPKQAIPTVFDEATDLLNTTFAPKGTVAAETALSGAPGENFSNNLVRETRGDALLGSSMPAASDEGLPNLSRRTPDNFSNLPVAESSVTQPFSQLDVVGRSDMLSMVRGLLNNPQVLDSVVRLVPVDVVNMLGGTELSTQDLLQKPSVLIDLLPVNADNLVSSTVAAMDVLAPTVAGAATEINPAFAGFDVPPGDNLAAIPTMDHVEPPVFPNIISRELLSDKQNTLSNGNGLPALDVKAAIGDVVTKWKNAPQIEVVQSVADLPSEVSAKAQSGTAVRGAWFGGNRVVLVADHIPDTDTAIQTVLHEAVGHYGIRYYLGAEFDATLQKVVESVGLRALRPIAAKYNLDLTKQADLMTAAEEKLAELAQTGKNPSLLGKAINAIRKWLRSLGFNVKWGRAEITELIARSRRFVEDGAAPQAVTKRSTDNAKSRQNDTIIPAVLADIPVGTPKEATPSPVQAAKAVAREAAVKGDREAQRAAQKGVVKAYDEAIAAAERGEPLRLSLSEDPAIDAAVQTGIKRHAEKALDVVRTISNRVSGLGNLPNQEEYLTARYLTLGEIAKVEEIEHNIYKAFRKATPEDAVAVYKYLTTKNADSATIADESTRTMAEKTKNILTTVGERLVDRGLLAAETYEANKGSYLPRIYLKHLLPDDVFKAVSSGQKPSDMGYLKKRKDIPEEVRRLILGEIKDPGYLASRGIGVPLRDMALLDWLDTISQNEEWVLPKSVIKFTAPGTDHTVRATPYYLKDEAARLRKRLKHMPAEDQDGARAIADAMDEAADEAIGEISGTLPKDYRQMPMSIRYGALRGMVVRKEIYNDIVGAARIYAGETSTAEKFLGQNGILTRYTGWWKWSKVAANPPAQFRNFISNLILLQLSGVSAHMVVPRLVQAIKEIRHNGEHWQVAKQYGVTKSTFANAELIRMEKDLLRLEAHVAGKSLTMSYIKRIWGTIVNATSDLYQFIESISKTAKIIDEMEKGRTPGQAAQAAHKALIDYSLVHANVKYLRNAPIGVPFLTFATKVMPMLLEVALTAPWRFAPYLGLIYALTAYVANDYDVEPEDLDKLKKALPEWLADRGHAYFLPVKDKYGRWQAIDLGYYFPWTVYAEIGREFGSGDFNAMFQDIGLFGGPVPSMLTALAINKDPYTKKDIVDKYATPSEELAQIMGYLWNLNVPTWMTDRGALMKSIEAYNGTVNKWGDPKVTPTQAAGRWFGINIYSIEPEITRAENIRRKRNEMMELKRQGTIRMRDLNLSDEERAKLAEKYREKLLRQADEIRKYVEESEINPKLIAPTDSNE